MKSMFTVEPLSEELLKYYEKKPNAMTNEEREDYIRRKKEAFGRWAKPLGVEELPAGDDPNYDDGIVRDDVLNSISLVSNLWIKQMIFANAGDMHPGHRHSFDHQTLLAKGSVDVIANGKTTTFVAPAIIYIKKGINHGMIARENMTVVYCIHPLRDGERVEDIIDPDFIPEGVMPLVETQGKNLIPVERI
ncbi:MAG: hypothetical protein EB127_25740 [Alphaproteobacteria bacterium]|nr:hypothetical protein [Alphaproteobacteria bacterium]